MTTIVVTVFVIGLIIFVHELGHFLVAKKVGVKVERFSLGFPPKMIGKRIGETEYCVSWIPFGGYVKLAGQSDIGEPELQGEPWEFPSKSLPARMGIIAAGPGMNFLSAFLLFSAIVLFEGLATYNTTRVGEVQEGSPAQSAGIRVGDRIISVDGKQVKDWDEILRRTHVERGRPIRIELERNGEVQQVNLMLDSDTEVLGIAPYIEPRVGSVARNSPAERAGIRKGDLIIAVNGQKVQQWADMARKVHSLPGETITLEWERGGEHLTATLTTDIREDFSKSGGTARYGVIGISLAYDKKKVGPLRAVQIGAWQTAMVTYMILSFVKGLITGEVSPRLLGGPVMIAQLAGESARWGVERLLNFTAFLSVNLGLVNLFPIHILDGGLLLFLAIEAIIRRPIPRRLRMVSLRIGLALIIILMLYVTINDITRWIR
ncbi:MAG TPA: RIP metalloprotease RseP [Candidatus Latescibacteria bacterium]|nr:RIP metalloprotease RseP [Candidatus Latescibacterota bacterium]